MGVNYDLHQISYCNASRKLYVEIEPVKITEVVKPHPDWGIISSRPRAEAAEEGEEETQNPNNPSLTLHLPKDHKRVVTKTKVI